jgi:molybdate transport system substrate-binding protein
MSLRVVATAVLATTTLALGACGDGEGETITVFAAASLTEAFTELAEAFERQHPDVEVRLSVAGSAALRTQILEGAPADVFASASPDEVETLVAAGIVIDARTLAANRLVVVTSDDGIRSFDNLAGPGVRLVLAAEDVPAGRYARESLALAEADGAFGADFASRVFANVRSNEANVRAALAKVELGEADAAIVYATDLGAAGGDVRAVPIPERFQPAAHYRIALLSENEQARAFTALATSAEGAAILARYGFAAVEVAP